jgi:hypothetical protein
MKGSVLALCLATALSVGVQAWKNPRRSPSIDKPIFGTHDYIAFQGYVLAGRPTWIKNNLNAFFIGTEAPDNGLTIPGAIGAFNDATRCHCILFDAAGNVTDDRVEVRAREEFDHARQALSSGNRKLAAFYAGTVAHYVGDLSQFHHIMGSKSHWGAEDQKLHAAYEVAVEATMDFKTRSSSLLDSYITARTVTGTTPETIARTAARYTEKGTGGRTTGWMYAHWKALRASGKSSVADWDSKFKDQTGQNVNVAANAIAKLFRAMP